MELTKNDIHNLLVFLERVQLTGGEAMTFVELCSKLNSIANNEGEEKSNESD